MDAIIEYVKSCASLFPRMSFGNVFEILVIATLIYFCLTFPTSKIIAYFERRMSRGDKR